MAAVNAAGFEERLLELSGWPARVRSYRIGARWHARVDNVSPGATVARGNGATREEAEEDALAAARARFAHTRRLEVTSRRE